MTVLTVELPDFTSPGGRADRIRFQDTTNGLIDATALRIITGDAIITRMQINGDQDRCLMQIVETLGDPPGDVNPSLSGVWEQYNPAIILQATGLTDLEISGPVAAGSDSTDTTEPYSWLPGSLITYTGGLEQWVADFKAAYASDNTLRATMVLDDGATGPQAHAVDAGDVSIAVAVSQPTVTHVAGPADHAVDAGDVSVAVAVSEPTVTHTSPNPSHTVDAGGVNILVTVSQPTVFLSGPVGALSAPTSLSVRDTDYTALTVDWTAPASDGGSPITNYEYRIGASAWASTGTSATSVLIGGLTAGTTYSITVRAVNGIGTGPASAALSATTTEAMPPSIPLFVVATPTGGTGVDLAWRVPASEMGAPITRYEICVIDDDGVALPFEPTDGPALRWRVRGLAFNHRYGFRVRAANSAGTGPQTPLVYAMPIRPAVVTVPPGQRIPLLDLDRQSLIVRLAGQDCRIRVWWQPSDLAWYGGLEVPVNTTVIDGRRLSTGAGFLDRLPDVLPGNVVCRAIDEDSARADPTRDAWRRQTHSLFWEPA